MAGAEQWKELMAFDEHILVKIGLDKQEFELGIKGVQSFVRGFGEALGAIGIEGALRGLTQYAEQISNTSEALGVSTNFLQGWQNALQKTGVESDKAQQSLGKFVQWMGKTGKEGQSVQEALGDLAEQVKNTPDPVERARLAFDAFGKSGARMIPVLMEGRDAVKAFNEETGKISPTELENLTRLNDSLEGAGRMLKRTAAAAVEVWAGFWRALGAASAGGNDSENMAQERIRRQKQEAINQEAIARSAEITKMNKELDEQGVIQDHLRDAEREIKKEQEDNLRLAKERTNAINEIFKASKRVSEAEREAKQEDMDRTGLTLHELASSRAYTMQGVQNVLAARRAEGLMAFAHQARIEGRQDLAEQAKSRADAIRAQLDPLTSTERNPMEKIQQHTAEAAERLQEILDKGIDVKAA